MSERSTEQIRELLDSLYRVDSRRILATLIRLLGDFDLAEEAMHEAFAVALSLWPTVPHVFLCGYVLPISANNEHWYIKGVRTIK
jgi:hypothetical protein